VDGGLWSAWSSFTLGVDHRSMSWNVGLS
jgi:hypothetical protein